jgi:hypothetical protein
VPLSPSVWQTWVDLLAKRSMNYRREKTQPVGQKGGFEPVWSGFEGGLPDEDSNLEPSG